MARFLKNPDLANGAQAARLPIVPSSAYGDVPTNGLIRFNQATNRVEFFYLLLPGGHEYQFDLGSYVLPL